MQSGVVTELGQRYLEIKYTPLFSFQALPLPYPPPRLCLFVLFSIWFDILIFLAPYISNTSLPRFPKALMRPSFHVPAALCVRRSAHFSSRFCAHSPAQHPRDCFNVTTGPAALPHFPTALQCAPTITALFFPRQTRCPSIILPSSTTSSSYDGACFKPRELE